ncbi:hypothetical protein EV182_008291, partial [Spiromyces aspiralis]
MGANHRELKQEMKLLMYVAFPRPDLTNYHRLYPTAHPHTKLTLPTMEALLAQPILFPGSPSVKVDAIGKKLGEFLGASDLANRPLASLLETLTKLLKGEQELGSENTDALVSILAKMYEALAQDKRYPLLDIVRLLMTTVSTPLESDAGLQLLARIINDAADS